MEVLEADLLIVGGGPVGIFTAFQAGMLGMKSIIVDSGQEVGGQCTALYPEKPIYDIPGFTSISGAGLINNLIEQASFFNPTYLLNSVLLSVEEAGDLIAYTNNGYRIQVKSIIIAAGSGRIKHKRLPIEGAENYEGKTLFYSIIKKDIFQGKIVTIAGGGDSAIDWANELAKICKKINIIHRREKFSCLESSYQIMQKNKQLGLVDLYIPYQLESIEGDNGQINTINISNFDNSTLQVKTDFLLAFFGLDSNLAEIESLGIEFDRKLVKVDHKTMETSRKKIFAVGDACTYEGKLKLILTGFAEAALACHNAYNYAFPAKKLHFEYSTTKGLKNI